jgi:hypothetical protein
MLLKSLIKTCTKLWTGGVLLAALAQSGCISATAPILTDAQAILGDHIEVHLFSGPKGGGAPHAVVTYQWNGSRYLPREPPQDFGDFTIHPYEGRDLIVQTRAVRPPGRTEFALARRWRSGSICSSPSTRRMPTRARATLLHQDPGCRLPHFTPEQLFVFARATAPRTMTAAALP